MHKTPEIAPKRDKLQGEYNPAWEPKRAAHEPRPASREPGTCVVIGAGLAGAAVAASLARRGWQVTVLDAADTPASGASALPAGFLVPHVSSDDSLLSRLSRSGVRLTLQQADALLRRGADWAHTGVLQHIVDGNTKNLPQDWATSLLHEAADWSQIASAGQLAQCGLPASASALWHAQAGWIKPAELVKAWLKTPGITWRGNAKAARLQATQHGWQVVNDSHEVLAQADLVVLAAAYGSRALAATANAAELALQPVRGQVSWGMHSAQPAHWPAFPVNGNGSLAPTVPLAGGLAWVVGASYERDCAAPKVCPQDHQENFARLQTLLPETAAQMKHAGAFDDTQVNGWSGIRCATPGRLPLLAQIATSAAGAPVWVCTGMGSRGLTFAVLCAELLAARLHGEPLPLEQRLAQALERNVRA